MIGKNTYFAMRKSVKGSVTAENRLGSLLNGTAAFSVDAMVRVMELTTDKSVLKIEGIIDFGIHEDGIYVKLPGYPVIYSNSSQGTLKTEEWFHIGMTTDGSRVSLYLEGNYNCCVFGQAAGANGNNSIMIGDGFTGDIRYVRIFSECLDADTMKEIMHETNLSKIPLAWYDFTQNPAKEQISGKLLSLNDAYIKSFTSAICLRGNSYLEVKAEDLMEVRPGYYGTQQYSVQVQFKFVTGEDDTSRYYSILSDLTEYYLGGIHLYLERMEDGVHLCFVHAFDGIEWNTVVSNSIIRQGKWINAAVVFNVETATMYIDGKVDCKKEGLLPAFEYDTGRMFLVGAKRDDVTDSIKNYFAGYISQCDVWERALSDEEVQAYIRNEPDVDAEELGFALNIDNDGCFNAVTYNGVALGNHAKVEEEVSDTLSGTSEVISLRQSVKEQLSETELSEIYEMCLNQWITYYEANHPDCGSEMPFRVKAWCKEGIIYFVGCHNGKAYTIGTIEEKDASEVVIWWVELVLMVIGGVCAAVFGLHLGTGSKAINKLVNILYSSATLANALKCMTFGNITADTFLQLFTLLYKENVLLEILKLLISGIAFWSVFTICMKFASWALGYGWAAAAVQLTALVVQVGIHIASYPDRDFGDGMCSVTLSEVKFSDLPLDGMGRKPDNTMNVGDMWVHNKSGLEEFQIKSYDVIKNGTEIRLLSQWSRDRNSQTVAVYSIQDKDSIILLRAGFLFTNSFTYQITANIKCRGSVFYGESNTVTFHIGPKQSVTCESYFQIPLNNINDVMNVKEEQLCWEIQYPGMEWKSLQSINVRVYTIFDEPKLQWQNKPIWSDALELLLPVMHGENSGLVGDRYDDLYRFVTVCVNSQMNLVYSPISRFSQSRYGSSELNLSAFINCVRTPDVATFVNCSDCAAVVAAFCNLLGGAVACERMQNISDYNTGFKLNPVIVIGTNLYNYGDEKFLYHEVAMRHISWANDTNNTTHKVYDASLQVNISNNPSSQDCNVQLPTGMSFSQYTDNYISGNAGQVDIRDDSYREHLCAHGPEGIGSCYYVSLPFGMAVPTII